MCFFGCFDVLTWTETFFKAVSETKCLIAFLPNKIPSFDYNPKSCRRFTERLVNF